MLSIITTEKLAGVTISGNYSDLNTLYDALTNIVGDEGSYPDYDRCCLRILGLCYEIRHAYQGDRNTFIDDYDETDYSFEYLWPEMVFVYGVLNDFIRLSGGNDCYLLQEKADTYFFNPEVKRILLEHMPVDIAYIEYFRALIRNAFKKTIDEKKYKRIFNALDNGYSYTLYPQRFYDYCTQWIDIQNVKYLKRNPDKRKTYLATVAEKILFRNTEYDYLYSDLMKYEKELGIPYCNIELEGMQYPDKVEW